jgi:hypothetical protein
MLKAKPAKEIVLKVRNEIGLLAGISRLIADKGVNILAACAWVEGDNAGIRLLTADNLRVADALRANNYNPREADVVLVETPHKPGLLKHLTEKLSQAGIDIHHLYASATAEQDKCLVVFSCAHNDRAIVLLNQ